MNKKNRNEPFNHRIPYNDEAEVDSYSTKRGGGGGHVDVGGTNQGNKETRENIKKKK